MKWAWAMYPSLPLCFIIFTDTDYSREEIAGMFGEKIGEPGGSKQKWNVFLPRRTKTQEETFKQMLLTVNWDIRGVSDKTGRRPVAQPEEPGRTAG